MSIKRLLLVGASVVAFAGAAQAADRDGWYIGGELGANWIQDTDFDETNPPALPALVFDTDFDTGYAGFVTAGYAWDALRLELEVGYRDNDGDATETTFGGLTPTQVDVEQLNVFLNLLYDIHLTDSLTLSLGGGIGGLRADAELIGFGPVTVLDRRDWTFGYQGIAGLSLAVSDHVDLFSNYRYTRGDFDFESTSAAFGDFEADIENHTLTIGLRYWFGAPAVAPMVDEPPPVIEQPMAKTYIVFFDFGKANLTAAGQEVVAEAAAAYAQGANVVLIVGHTDTVGSAGYNQKLSERRAANVKAEMVRLGVPADNITTEGRGFSDPMVPTGPGVREPQNRRAVIELQ